MQKVCMICMVFLYMMLPGVSLAGNLTDNRNGTVTDSGTMLIWQRGENSAMSWEAALTYCEDLTLAEFTDWLLPNIKELSSLVDDTISGPAIDRTFFPNALFPDASHSNYWSSTTEAYSTSDAWIVNFVGGLSYYYGKTNSSYVRCVRGGQ